MVEDMDEAAVYGSPMYRVLENAFGIGRSESEEGGSSADEEKVAGQHKEKVAGQQPTVEADTIEDGPEDSEANGTADFHRTLGQYRRGEVDARRVLAVLTRIHGEGLSAWWPLVLAALPPHEVRS